MRISVSHHWKQDKRRGFKKFAALLLKELVLNHEVQIVGSDQRSDIHLTMIHGPQKKKSKNILRIDGVYYDKGRLTQNRAIAQSIRCFDAVVFQSKWCETFATRMLNVRPKVSKVIYNGTKQNKVTNIEEREFDRVFVCCANWRPNKRLKAITKAFLRAREASAENWGLFVLGNPDYEFAHDSIRYFGYVDDPCSIYRSSDYMCHICHLDACPNSVVEGLSAGLPVLCNNIGGTPELVKDSGIILNMDEPFNFKPVKNMEAVGSRSVNQQLLVNGMLEMSSRLWNVNRPDLDISVSARAYYELFEYILGN